MAAISKIRPNLWFDGQAEAAANFYVSIFKNARILSVDDISAGPAEGNKIVTFELEDLQFTAFDAGPHFRFTLAISFEIACDSQAEIDYFWEKLGHGGETQQCGWLQDRFGLSWQISPAELPQLMQKNPKAVMEAYLAMTKVDIAQLRAAAQQGRTRTRRSTQIQQSSRRPK